MNELENKMRERLSDLIKRRDFDVIRKAMLNKDLLVAFPNVAQVGIALLIDHLEQAIQAVDSIEESLDRSR